MRNPIQPSEPPGESPGESAHPRSARGPSLTPPSRHPLPPRSASQALNGPAELELRAASRPPPQWTLDERVGRRQLAPLVSVNGHQHVDVTALGTRQGLSWFQIDKQAQEHHSLSVCTPVLGVLWRIGTPAQWADPQWGQWAQAQNIASAAELAAWLEQRLRAELMRVRDGGASTVFMQRGQARLLGLEPLYDEVQGVVQARRERECRQAQASEQARRDTQAREQREALDGARRQFLRRESIDVSDFVALCHLHQVELHPRTRGTLKRHVLRIRNGHVKFQHATGSRRPALKGAFDAAQALHEALQNGPAVIATLPAASTATSGGGPVMTDAAPS